MNIFIYLLSDSREPLNYRYIGQSYNPSWRQREHILEATGNRKKICYCHKCNLIRKIIKEGAKIHCEVLEMCETDKDANITEQFWISMFRFWGYNLVNCTDGGEGVRGFKHTFSKEHKRKLSIVAKNRKHTKETWEKIKQSLTNRIVTSEQIEKNRQGQFKRWSGEKGLERKRLLSNKLKGRKLSEEQKKKFSIVQKEFWKTEKGQKKKQELSNRNLEKMNKYTPEQRSEMMKQVRLKGLQKKQQLLS